MVRPSTAAVPAAGLSETTMPKGRVLPWGHETQSRWERVRTEPAVLSCRPTTFGTRGVGADRLAVDEHPVRVRAMTASSTVRRLMVTTFYSPDELPAHLEAGGPGTEDLGVHRRADVGRV